MEFWLARLERQLVALVCSCNWLLVLYIIYSSLLYYTIICSTSNSVNLHYALLYIWNYITPPCLITTRQCCCSLMTSGAWKTFKVLVEMLSVSEYYATGALCVFIPNARTIICCVWMVCVCVCVHVCAGQINYILFACLPYWWYCIIYMYVCVCLCIYLYTCMSSYTTHIYIIYCIYYESWCSLYIRTSFLQDVQPAVSQWCPL